MKTHISETCQKKEQNKLSREATDERADGQRRFERDRKKIKICKCKKDQQFESKLIIKDRNSSLKILNQVLGVLRISTEL